jgi:ABC-type bacteriocin/lantibiotic exporter with double-glycine peptidase domain
MKNSNKILFPLKKLSLNERVVLFYIIIFLFFVTLIDIVSLFFLSIIASNEMKDQLHSNVILSKIILILNLDKNIDLYKLSATIFVFSIIFRNIFSFIQQLIINNFVYDKYAKYSYELLKTYVLSNSEKFFSKNYSYYLKNVIKETQNVFLGILYAIIYLFIDFIYVISLIVYTFFFLISDFNKELILFLSFAFIIILYFIFFLKKIGKVKTLNEEGLYKDAYETLISFVEIKIIKHVDLFLESFKKKVYKFSSLQVIYGSINTILKPILEILISIVILYFIIFEKNNNYNIYGLVVLLFLIFRFTPVLSRISGNLNTLSYHNESSQILSEEFRFYNFGKKKLNTKIKKNVNSIALKNIFFKHSSKLDYLIKNLSLTFKKGSITGLYGESGSGKTTLLLIICGLLNVNKGNYLINNIKIRKNLNIDWNGKISYMSQTPYIIDNSLKHSIFFEKELAKNKDLINKTKELFKKFNLSHLIKFLGFENLNISLRGTLSAGEKQRIAFIRCLINSPQIFILDEPTASLDEKNEKILINELLKIKKTSIVIMATHNKNLIKYFDKTISL